MQIEPTMHFFILGGGGRAAFLWLVASCMNNEPTLEGIIFNSLIVLQQHVLTGEIDTKPLRKKIGGKYIKIGAFSAI
jgi:hypothetical protein